MKPQFLTGSWNKFKRMTIDFVFFPFQTHIIKWNSGRKVINCEDSRLSVDRESGSYLRCFFITPSDYTNTNQSIHDECKHRNNLQKFNVPSTCAREFVMAHAPGRVVVLLVSAYRDLAA